VRNHPTTPPDKGQENGLHHAAPEPARNARGGMPRLHLRPM